MDAVVARNLSGHFFLSTLLRTIRQRTDTGELENDMLTTYMNTRENPRHQTDKIIDLFCGAAGLIGVFDWNIRGANNELVVERENQHNAAIAVFEEKLAFADGPAQFGMLQHQVRAFGPANITAGEAQAGIDGVDPRAGSVDDQARSKVKSRTAQFILQHDFIPADSCERDII